MRQAATQPGTAGTERSVHEEKEHELAARLIAGDVSAFAKVLEAYWEPLVAYAARMLGTHDAAEDAVQETFVRLWERRDTLKPRTSPSGYLYRLTRNLVIDELRRGRVRNHSAAQLEAEACSPPTPAQVTEAEDLEAAAARALERMAERRREVFMLAHFHDLSYRQIAEALDIAPQTVANHMTLALRELRAALRPYLEPKLGPP